MMRLPDRALRLLNFATSTGINDVSPEGMGNESPLGPYQVQLQSDLGAVAAAAKAGRDDGAVFRIRNVAFRSFLERHNHDGTQLKKLIVAMLDSS